MNTYPCINFIINDNNGYIIYNGDRRESVIMAKFNKNLKDLVYCVKNFLKIVFESNLVYFNKIDNHNVDSVSYSDMNYKEPDNVK